MPLSSTQKARIYAVSYCAYHFGILEQGTYACNDMHIILFGFDPCAGEVFPFSAYTCIPYPHEHVLKVKSLYLEIDEATVGLFRRTQASATPKVWRSFSMPYFWRETAWK
jgi:hypothetical protein